MVLVFYPTGYILTAPGAGRHFPVTLVFLDMFEGGAAPPCEYFRLPRGLFDHISSGILPLKTFVGGRLRIYRAVFTALAQSRREGEIARYKATSDTDDDAESSRSDGVLDDCTLQSS